MAEASHDLRISEPPDESRRVISVLLLGTRWQFDTYGLSTTNKSPVNNLRLVDSEAKTIKITCAVVEEEGKITDADLKDAGKHGVELRGAQRPRCKKQKKPKLQWLDEDAVKYYIHLVQDQKYDFIIGHAPYMANGCFNLKGVIKNKNKSLKTILLFHTLPKDENGDVDNDMLIDWLTEADIVFSLGKRIEDELVPHITALDPEERPIHKRYLPSYPLDMFTVKQDNTEGKVRGTQNVSMMSGEIKDLDINGLDFPSAVTATAGASEHMRKFEDVRTYLTLLVADEAEKLKWKETSEEVIRKQNLNDTGLTFQVEAPLTIDKMKVHVRKSNLFLLPLKQNSPLFGTEALAAIAAGVPVLVSRDSGLAALLREMQQDEPIVYKIESEVKVWKERIIQQLINPKAAQQRANTLREQLLLDTSIAQTHLDFINVIADSACIQLEMEIQTDSVISEHNVKTTIQFGVEISNPIDAKKYIIGFLKQLLLQREKIDNNLLETHLDPKIAKLWQEVRSSLEETNRELIDIQSGSLVFTLFCPNHRSVLQLRDSRWGIELQGKMDQLMNELGVVAQSKILNMKTIEPQLLQKRTNPNQKDSEDRSTGYETMTTLSNSDSEVIRSEYKVGHLLSQQHDVKSGDGDGLLKLVEAWIVEHVQMREDNKIHLGNSFSISESEMFGISCFEKPSLSVMYPGTDKSPAVLSNDKIYRSATFVKISGKEYLAAACDEDGCLYLWDIDSKTSKKVFDPKLPSEQLYKGMNIFKINNNTVGYGEVFASLDGSRRVFLLKTDTEELTLSSTRRLFTPKNIYDMCCTEVDATPCLLCVTHDNRITAMEMIGGRTRWQVGKQQMGEKFQPWSIYTDQNDCTYVADFGQRKIHVLSTSEGSLLKQFDGRNFGISNIFTVRFHDEHFYVEHKIPGSKYSISKFKESEEG